MAATIQLRGARRHRPDDRGSGWLRRFLLIRRPQRDSRFVTSPRSTGFGSLTEEPRSCTSAHSKQRLAGIRQAEAELKAKAAEVSPISVKTSPVTSPVTGQ